jgi:anti-sigma-K factor RskA
MSEDSQNILYDLLEKRAVYGLDEAEQQKLKVLLQQFDDDESFDLAVAAISMVDVDIDEQMPAHLMAKIAADAGKVLDAPKHVAPAVTGSAVKVVNEVRAGNNFWNYLGWAVAGIACIALAINIGMTRFGGVSEPEPIAKVTPTPGPEKLTDMQMRQRLIDTSPDLVKATWTDGNMKDLKGMSGDVVWSDAKQAGYMTFHGMPANDPNQATYQLWIFDETQDEKTPIDGGTFDVQSNGDVIIPINAKLKARNPKMFAITMEKPGGVVVSKREKLPALAKVATSAV